MRCALYFEFDIAEAEEVWKRNEKIQADREKNPDKYPKDIFPPQGHLFGKPAGFYIVEGTEKQIFRFTQAWAPLKKFRVEIITDAEKLPAMAGDAQKIK